MLFVFAMIKIDVQQLLHAIPDHLTRRNNLFIFARLQAVWRHVPLLWSLQRPHVDHITRSQQVE